MSDDVSVAQALKDAIIKGSYPQSEELLTSDLSSNLISSLLSQITQTRAELSHEIGIATRGETKDVHQWIVQARKVQEDIAKCKLESRKIVEEHVHLQNLRSQAADHNAKVNLLNSEIEFSETLKHEFSNIALASQALKEVEADLLSGNPFGAADKLNRLGGHAPLSSRSRSAIITRDLKDELRLKTRVQLEAKLHAQINVQKEQYTTWIQVSPTETTATSNNSDSILRALDQLGEPQDVVESLTDKLRTFFLSPLRKSSRLKYSAYRLGEHKLTVELGHEESSFDKVFDYVSSFTQFLHTSMSKTIQDAAVQAIYPDLMALLVNDWLTPELPIDLDKLDRLDQIRQQMNRLLDQLETLSWHGRTELQAWTNQINRIWLAKRKAATLDAVRKGLASSKGVLRQVERVETRIIDTQPKEHAQEESIPEDWNANWDEDATEESESSIKAKAQDAEDDEASGWGFDDDDDDETAEAKPAETSTDNQRDKNGDDGEEEDAWGWGDEDTENKTVPTKKQGAKETNTTNKNEKEPAEPQQQTLSEWYSISEVPDYILETIGKDVSDAEILKTTTHASLDTSILSRGLLALPTLAMAMFRATAPSYYGASPSLTDIHRYNDSLYIVDRLGQLDVPGMSNLEGDIKAIERFARAAYSKEMETQRLIVWDLLEGAQGFSSCTQFPYSQEIENAVSAVVDRVRALHIEWQPVLSPSVLLQSIGTILTTVTGKIIYAIEELDDISEPESRKLTEYCQQVAGLDDLFPRDDSLTGQPVSSTAVYVPSWIRFQYLIQILESSLVDIRYLWTEGELSLEFSQREVVSLIQALFAESRHRRDAINAILAKQSPWDL
ncbi:hypothetical protein B0A52_04459 [Exophiala mesophila]|uniref:Retrograde transport protein Dsl1 C-terminal domain-containing protein n=1 Tax=Exophiala mesophila TaxID=212818 RepID=A0A438N926_EXOME|nr:hypothetical protein B0A52_04459 [Exophiala mesophila]